ncbi:MAG TPA: MG2 domain-containing protein [Pyrinomonadaceae bacterium]|jgi:hypothetical protein
MKTKLIRVVLLGLLLAAAANGQVFLKVDASETKATFENDRLHTKLVVESSANSALPARVKLEVLDADDQVLAASETGHKLARGKQSLAIPVAFNAGAKPDELLWKRLRYTVSVENSGAFVSNIVSLSEIMPEVFELQISAPENIYAGMNLRAHVLALHPFTRKPIGNVAVGGEVEVEIETDAEEDEITLKAKAATNGEGFASLEFKIPENIKIEDGDITIKGVKNGIAREAYEDLDAATEAFLYLNTDKPIYQPVQKLFVRGLYLDAQKRPLVDRDLEFEIRDENYRTVYEGKTKTSRFGVANVEWQIPADLRLGNYKIEFENDDGDEIGETGFKVSRYELPNFTIAARSAKPYYLSGENSAEITVSAAYLFGKPVAGGRVRIVREKERNWNYGRQRYDTEEGAAVEGEAGAEGKFTAKVDLSDAQENLNASGWKRFDDVKFAAYYTDPTTNRTEQRRFDVRITKEAIHVYFIRQNADPNPKVPFLFYVSTFYADGTPAKCDLKIDGGYRYTNMQTKVAEGGTNSYGAGKFEARFPEKPSPDATGEFNLRIAADDRKGGRGLLEDSIYIDSNKKQLRLRTDKTIYLPGQPIALKIFSSENERTVYVDVLKDSSVVYSKSVRVEDARGHLAIPFRADFKGELTIAAYFRKEDGDAVVASKTVLYPGATNLILDLKSLKTTYRPNEEAKISFSVRDGERGPSEAALGVLILDKAIEERARAERLPDNFAGVRKLLGTADSFGDLTRRDLDNLDLAKPPDADLQLAAEFLLANKTYEPNFFESDAFQDDFSRIYKKYFSKKLAVFETILRENYEQTGDAPRGENELRRILAAGGVNFEELRDAWETPFQTRFAADRGFVGLTLKTAGADEKFGTDDDFIASELRFDVFRKLRLDLASAFNDYLRKGGKTPQTEDDLKAIWKAAGRDFDELRDGWNRPLYLEKSQFNRQIQKMVPETVGSLDGERQQAVRSKMVEQKVDLYRLWSVGADGARGSYDDFAVDALTIVLEEKDLTGALPNTEIFKTPGSNAKGAVGGTLFDPNGAVIPGARISVENMNSGEIFSAISRENGEFLVADLPSGKYKITAESPGFRNYVIDNVVISSMNLITLKITLDVGAVTETVDVTSERIESLNASSASMKTVTGSAAKSIAADFENDQTAPTFTPRVREYFPETLVWQPELLTGKNGRAELNFRLGDNLTTWKLYAIGSTETGEVGMVEKEFQTFQPFFAELDPPRVLTEGDRLDLPVPVRNYTDKRRKVTVSIEENSWSKILNGAAQNIEVAPNSTANAVFNLQAFAPVSDGKQKVTALAKSDGDAIEKNVTVRPNGREFAQTASNLFTEETAFRVDFPANAFRNTRRAQVKIYPNMFAHVAESIEGLLVRPHGCGEQTTSSTYPNLLILKIEKDLKKELDPDLKKQARSYLEEGYKRLLNYQTGSGGFSFWGKTDAPNTALTAYVLRFLHDAEEFTEVGDEVVERAENWLIAQQKTDGGWESNGGEPVTTAYVLRSLSLTSKNDPSKQKALRAGIEFLKKRLTETENPFVLANLALVAIETEDSQTAQIVVEKLEKLARPDNSFGQFWTTPGTPFYGWGKSAGIETTALVVQAFLRFAPPQPDLRYQRYIFGGLNHLLKNKDRYGVWYSTQTTVNALDALILFQRIRSTVEKSGDQERVEIFVNGAKAQEFSLSASGLSKPFIFDATPFLSENENRLEIKTAGARNLTMAQVVSQYYVDWNEAREVSPYFDLRIEFDKLQAKPTEEITCRVGAQRKNNQFGMVLTEIGLPPGADVDRGSLERAKADSYFSSFDVLPDRIVIYSWMGSQPLEFAFKFRPRFGLNAQSAPSQIYDYYNEEARAIVAPARFEVK